MFLGLVDCQEKFFRLLTANFDAFVKSQEFAFSVIPAKAGIQSFQLVTECLDSGFHRSDDFLRDRQFSLRNNGFYLRFNKPRCLFYP